MSTTATRRLEGKVAVITGAGSGMGRATALRFLQEGASVMVADLNESTGLETVSIAIIPKCQRYMLLLQNTKT